MTLGGLDSVDFIISFCIKDICALGLLSTYCSYLTKVQFLTHTVVYTVTVIIYFCIKDICALGVLSTHCSYLTKVQFLTHTVVTHMVGSIDPFDVKSCCIIPA